MNENSECKKLVASLSDYIDGTLSDDLCSELERHLQECNNCRVVVDTMRKTIELYHTAPGAQSLPEDVRERLFYRLDLGDYLK